MNKTRCFSFSMVIHNNILVLYSLKYFMEKLNHWSIKQKTIFLALFIGLFSMLFKFHRYLRKRMR